MSTPFSGGKSTVVSAGASGFELEPEQRSYRMHSFHILVTKPKLLSLSAFLRCPVVISGLGRRGSNRGRSTEKSHRDFDPLESGRLPDLSIDPRPTADHCVTLNTLLTFSEPQDPPLETQDENSILLHKVNSKTKVKGDIRCPAYAG